MSPFPSHKEAAMALLTSGAALKPKEGQFCGGLAFTDDPLTERQHHWLVILLRRHNLPELAE